MLSNRWLKSLAVTVCNIARCSAGRARINAPGFKWLGRSTPVSTYFLISLRCGVAAQEPYQNAWKSKSSIRWHGRLIRGRFVFIIFIWMRGHWIEQVLKIMSLPCFHHTHPQRYLVKGWDYAFCVSTLVWLSHELRRLGLQTYPQLLKLFANMTAFFRVRLFTRRVTLFNVSSTTNLAGCSGCDTLCANSR
mgnify:CR=1 FL=1